MRGRLILALLLILAPFLSAHAEEFDAVLQWSRRVELSTPVSGVIVEVTVQPGQHVKKDDVLLRLDTTVREANVAYAKAQMARQTRLRAEAQRELNRAQELFNATLLAEHEMELQRIAFDTAEVEFQMARATLAQAESDLKYSEIRAPYDAVILQRYAEVGQTVATQLQVTPLLVVAEDGRLVALAHATARHAQQLTSGQHVIVTIGGKRYDGRLQNVSLEAASDKTSDNPYAIAVTFATGDAILRAGQSAKISPVGNGSSK